MDLSKNIKKKAILISSLVECFLLGGPAYGWPSLVFVLRDRGYFSDLCVNNDQATYNGNNSSSDQNIDVGYPTCAEQDARLQLVFIIGIFGHNSGALIFGFIYDKFGTRIARLISSTLILLACLIFAFSGPSTSNLTFIALHLLATGSSNLIITNTQVGNIFGNFRSTVIGLTTGACGSSAVIMVFIQIAYNAGISMMASFSILAGITVFFTINTVLLPKYKFPWPLPSDLEKRKPGNYGGTSNVNENELSEFNASGSDPATTSNNNTLWVDVEYKTRLSCLSSPMFLLFSMWFSIIQLIHLFYLGTVNPRLQQLTGDSTDTISTYSGIYTVLYSTILVFSFFCGIVVDRNKTKMLSNVNNNDVNNQSHRTRSHFDDLRDFIPAFVITNLVTASFSVCSMIPILKLQILTFILQVMGRTFLYAIIAAFLALAFPAKYFGSVYGICAMIAACISLLQYPLLTMVQNVFADNFLYIDLFLVLLNVCSLSLPVMDLSKNRKKIILISSLAECLILGGPAYGWPSLVFVLRDRGYFSDLCVNSEQVTYYGNNSSSDLNIDSGYPTCAEQDARLQLVFIIGIFGHNSGALIFGFIYDKFGTRIARLISSTLILLACLIFAFSGPSTSNLTFIALHLLATGSSNLLVTSSQVGNIFGNFRSTVIGLTSGACASSAIIMVFIQIAYNAGISMMASFSFLAGITVFFTINTVLLPKYKFPWPLPSDLEKRKPVNYGGTSNVNENELSEFNASGSDPATTSNNDTLWVDVEYKTRLSCLSSPMFLLLLMWFSIIQLIHLFYLGTVNPRLQQLTGDSTDIISTYSEIFTAFSPALIVFAFCFGIVVDRNKTKVVPVTNVKDNESTNFQSLSIRSHFDDLQDFIPALIITNLVTVSFSVCSMIPILKLQILTFILEIIGRSFLYALLVAFLALAFPAKYFGSVYGICRIVAACISLLQYPLLQMVQNVFADNFLYIDLLLVLLNVCSLSLPVYVYNFVLTKRSKVGSQN
ncbi:uncharacterized protein [Antedon mediterranea]|uniref:uncharacterized protein n=1 Tax=Antedon mediterranea TaxID=105859 RepID=UPI003AF7E138